jgi:hypothetical protein
MACLGQSSSACRRGKLGRPGGCYGHVNGIRQVEKPASMNRHAAEHLDWPEDVDGMYMELGMPSMVASACEGGPRLDLEDQDQ